MIRKNSLFLITLIIIISVFGFKIIQANRSENTIIITEILYDTPGIDTIEEWIELYENVLDTYLEN